MGRSCYVRDLSYSFDSFCLRLIHFFFFFPLHLQAAKHLSPAIVSASTLQNKTSLFLSSPAAQLSSLNYLYRSFKIKMTELQNCVFIPVPSTGTAYCTRQHERFRQAGEQRNSRRKRKGYKYDSTGWMITHGKEIFLLELSSW